MSHSNTPSTAHFILQKTMTAELSPDIQQIKILWIRICQEINKSIDRFDVQCDPKEKHRTRSLLRKVIPKSIVNNIRARILPAISNLPLATEADMMMVNKLQGDMQEILKSIESIHKYQLDFLRVQDQYSRDSREFSLSVTMKELKCSCKDWSELFGEYCANMGRRTKSRVGGLDATDGSADLYDCEDDYVENVDDYKLSLKKEKSFIDLMSSDVTNRMNLYSYILARRKTNDLRFLKTSDSTESLSKIYIKNVSSALEESMKGFQEMMDKSGGNTEVHEKQSPSPAPVPKSPRKTRSPSDKSVPIISKKTLMKDLPPIPPDETKKELQHKNCSKKVHPPKIKINQEEFTAKAQFSPIPLIGTPYREYVEKKDDGSQICDEGSSELNSDGMHKKTRDLKTELKYVMQYENFLDAYEYSPDENGNVRTSPVDSVTKSVFYDDSPEPSEANFSQSTLIPTDLKKAAKALTNVLQATLNPRKASKERVNTNTITNIGCPTDFKHHGHIGRGKNGKLVLANVPPVIAESPLFVRKTSV